jgi:hypothetical protein
MIVEGATSEPTATPVMIVEGVTSAPSATAPATSTSTGGQPRGGSGSPLLALLVALTLGGLSLLAIDAQRRRVRR